MKKNLRTLCIYSHFGGFTADDGGKLEATIVSKVLPLLRELDDPIWELPPEMEYHGLHASLIVKGITKFHINLFIQGQFWNPQNK